MNKIINQNNNLLILVFSICLNASRNEPKWPNSTDTLGF